MRMHTPTSSNKAQKFLISNISADFPADIYKFQITPEQPIFVIKKRLIYEKASIFYEKQDVINIK